MSSDAIITLSNNVTIRPIRRSDAEEVARLANNYKIWINMSDTFPFPYTMEASHHWIDETENKEKMWASVIPPAWYFVEQGLPVPDTKEKDEKDLVRLHYSICRDDVPIGGLGVQFDKRTMFARKAEFGYWLGEESWGKGVGTEVCKAWTRWIFDTFPWIIRLQALVFGWNPASMAVLRKSGFEQEAIFKAMLWKEGKVLDEHLFVKFREGWPKSSKEPMPTLEQRLKKDEQQNGTTST